MYVYDISPYKISMPRFSGLLVITIKSETNCTFHTASMLFYIVHKICLNRSCTFLNDLLPKNFGTLHLVVLVSFPPHKFAHFSC